MKTFYVGNTVHGSIPAIVDPADGITPITPVSLTALVIKNGTDTGDTVTITTVGGGRVGVYKWSYDPASEVESDQFTIVFTITLASSVHYYNVDLVAVDNFDSTVDAVDVGSISGNLTAANNLELQYDGSGITGNNFPATQGQVGSLSTSAGGISVKVQTVTTTTVGTETNTVADARSLNGIVHSYEDSGGVIDFYYEFNVGVNGVATGFLWSGYAQGINDSVRCYGYDWVDSSWVQIHQIIASNGTVILEDVPFTPDNSMTGTGANSGMVRLRFESTDATLMATDRILCEYSSLAAERTILQSGIAQAATSSTITLATTANTTTDYYLRTRIILTEGTGAGQSRVAVGYSSGRVLTISPAWVVTPDATTNYDVVPAEVHATTQSGSYSNLAVHISKNGSTTAIVNVDGIDTNSIDHGSIANARIVADAKGLTKFMSQPGSVLTLNQSYDDWYFEGSGVVINLNGQSISGARLNQGIITGIGTGSEIIVIRDALLNNLTLSNGAFVGCPILGTFTCSGETFYRFERCSPVSAAGCSFDFGAAVGNTTLAMDTWSGRATILNLGQLGTDVLVVTGSGEVTLSSSCVGGTVYVFGDIQIVNNGSNVTIQQNADVTAILAALNDLQSNQGDWVTATGFSTHDAAAVVTALGTGSTLTTLATVASVAALNNISTSQLSSAVQGSLISYGVSTAASITALNDVSPSQIGSSLLGTFISYDVPTNTDLNAAVIVGNSALEVSHGSGSWATSGLATQAELDKVAKLGDTLRYSDADGSSSEQHDVIVTKIA